MPPSYVPSEATDFVKSMVKGMTFEDIYVRVADSIAKIMWMAAPWRWTVGGLDPNTTLVNGVADYPIATPSDFLYLERSYLWDGTSYRPLIIESYISTTSGIVGLPSRISYIDSIHALRLDPVPALGTVPTTLVNLYKKLYTPITVNTIDEPGVLTMPDEWTWVFEEGVLWKAWEYADDDRAGTSTITSDGKFQHTGQCARFWAGIQEMRNSEKLLVQWPGVDQQKG